MGSIFCNLKIYSFTEVSRQGMCNGPILNMTSILDSLKTVCSKGKVRGGVEGAKQKYEDLGKLGRSCG